MITAYIRAKSDMDAARHAASAAVAAEMRDITGDEWVPLSMASGIGAACGPWRVGWTRLDSTPCLSASWRGDGEYVAVEGPTCRAAWGKLGVRLRKMGVAR